MRIVPRSLRGRLMALSAVATLAALVFAGLAIGAVLERFVMQGLDQRLDGQIALLARAIGPDGQVDRGKIVSPAPYDEAGSGWGWRIQTPTEMIRSPGDAAPRTARRARHGDGPPPPMLDDRPAPMDWRDAGGLRRHARALTIATDAGDVRIVASAPQAIVARPIRAAMAPLLASLVVLGLALMLATFVQLRLGLRPLGQLRAALAAVRGGSAARVPEDQPDELRPLAAELNALLGDTEAQLASARGHVANLAHGLKTPLATLALRVREDGRDVDGVLAAEVARIDRAVRHHLGRARSDASGGRRARTLLAPAIEGLTEALSRIHAARDVTVTVAVPVDLAVAVDGQDLDEMLGNLLDNAWRFADATIRVTATVEAGRVQLRIADDGPGIPAAARAAAVEPGRRLDEAGDGHGFGLSIARELAELHGGALALDAADGGGLLVVVTLPLAGQPSE